MTLRMRAKRALVRSHRPPSDALRLLRSFGRARDGRLRMTDQLFSLLARFQEISSPMVELVLETGCL